MYRFSPIRNTVVFIFLISATIMSYAIESGKYRNGVIIEGDLHDIDTVHNIIVDLDMSQCSVEGMTIPEFIEYLKSDNPDIESDYTKALIDYKLDFINEANNSLKNRRLRLCNKCDSPIRMTIKIIETTRKGNEILYDYIFSNNTTNETIAIIRVYTKDGRFGDFLNLMGDATREAGEQFGAIYRRFTK